MTDYQKYKLIILSIASISLILICYSFSRNRRYYSYFRDPEFILDTGTGTIYYLDSKVYIKLNDFKEYKKEDKE